MAFPNFDAGIMVPMVSSTKIEERWVARLVVPTKQHAKLWPTQEPHWGPVGIWPGDIVGTMVM